MAAPGPRTRLNTPRPPDPRGQAVKGFWERVTEGLELAEIWNQFMTEAKTGYRLYSQEIKVDEESFATRGQRVKFILKSLFWAILTKLSPARRLLLLFAFVLLVVGFEFQVGEVGVHSSTTRLFAGLILLGLLLMEVADRVTLKRDLQIAREIQLWLVPETPPDIPGLEVAFYNRPANTVAGDFYDVFYRNPSETATSPVLLTVADVAGKSLPAALLMATFQASLHTLSGQTTSLIELTEGLNRYACEHSRGGQRFTTAFLAEYSPQSGLLTYINAGHNAPMLLRGTPTGQGDGRCQLERLDVGGLPLGIVPLAPYNSGTVTLLPGDTLFIFTDGLVEAVDAAGQEYSDERLIAAVKGNCQRNAKDMLNGIVRALDVFVGTTPQHDDMTCMIVRAVPSTEYPVPST